MNFKSFHISSVESNSEKINEFYEKLFEASQTYYNLTIPGKRQIFEKAFTEQPDNITTSTNFLVLNPANEEDKKKIAALKKKNGSTRIVLYTVQTDSFTKPSLDTKFFNVGKAFLTEYNLKASSEKEKELLDLIKAREVKRRNAPKDTSDVGFKLDDDEVITFLDIIKNSTNKFVRGIYYVYDVDNNELYELIYNKKDPKFSFDSLFSESAPYKGEEEDGEFKISGNAQQFEDVQVLGLYFDAISMEKSIKKFQKQSDLKIPYQSSEFKSIISPFESALKASDEFRDFNSIIKRDYKNFGFNDWIGICQLAGGMTQFSKDIVKDSNPFIVFESIPEFRKLETAKFNYKDDEDTAKVSTIDVVVSNISKDELFKAIKDSSTKLIPENGYIKVVDSEGKDVGKFWQITLKKSIDTAILGRTQKYFAKIYSMIVNSKETFESYKEFEELLTESVLEKLTDAAKKGAKFLKGVGQRLYDKIKYLILALKDWSNTLQKTLSRKTGQNAANDAKELYDLGLTESTKKEMNDVLMEIIHDAKPNYEKADLKISKLCNSMLNSQNNYVIVSYKEPTEPTKFTPNMFRRQIFNYSFLKAFKESVVGSKNPLSKYVDELLGLYIEAVYGASKLPLWKVYSTIPGEKAYEYLGQKENVKAERKENIMKALTKENMPLVYLNVGTGKDGVNSIKTSILSNVISESGKFAPVYTIYDVSFSVDTMEANFIALEERISPLADE